MHRFKDADLHKGSNKVMAIKSKFEHKENNDEQERHTKTLPSLSRQLSDPVKVKRTPAFRSDQKKPFQRGHGNAVSCRDRKSVLKVSDQPSNVHLLRQQFDSKDDLLASKHIPKALSERSNSSAEIILNKCAKQEDYVNIAALYTKPIPKSKRSASAIHNMSTLKISDKSHKTDVQKDDIHYKLEALTDTLRSALKKPLPTGPAPQKPPRTFMHQSSTTTSPITSKTSSPVMVNSSRKQFAAQLNSNLQKSLSTLKQHQNIANNNHSPVKSKPMTNNNATSAKDRKPDPKYMLDKLENALKTNKIRKSQTADAKKLDNLNAHATRSKLNLNCLHSLNCTNKDYERLPELMKNSKHDEPVYAEPFAFLKATYNDHGCVPPRTSETDKSNRNSLYYMSTPIASESTQLLRKQDAGGDSRDGSRNGNSQQTDDEAAMCDTPSSSSRSSLDEPPLRIKDLIRSFESGTTTSNNNNASSSPRPPPTDRVDKLEKQLRRTLEASFDDANAPTISHTGGSGDKQRQDAAILGKFETYVRTIKMITQSRQKYQHRQMFHCCMLVTLSDKVPFVKFKYPLNAELPSRIEELVFPDSTCFDSEPKAQCYSIVITTDDGQRIYGYCRRVLPEDSQHCLPLAYCILSRNRASGFYNRILEEIESRHGLPDKDRDILLQEFYRKRFPSPGDAVNFEWRFSDGKPSRHYALVNGSSMRNGNNTSPEQTDKEHVEIVLHQDARVNENDLEELCQCLDCATILLKVFASLLLERKVILLSRQLGRLSRCMEALQNILYPFAWPHTLIPVVPRDLWEIVEAPTPFICGVLSVNVVQEYEINDAIVVDLDNGKLLKEVGDEMRILPDCLVKEFKDGLALARTTRNSPNKDKRSIYNVLLSDAFVRIFVHSCGHYTEYLSDDEFDLERYVKHPKKKSIRQFLKWFTQTSMFSTFVDNIIADKNCYKIFDNRTRIYSARDATAILEKMKGWRRD